MTVPNPHPDLAALYAERERLQDCLPVSPEHATRLRTEVLPAVESAIARLEEHEEDDDDGIAEEVCPACGDPDCPGEVDDEP